MPRSNLTLVLSGVSRVVGVVIGPVEWHMLLVFHSTFILLAHSSSTDPAASLYCVSEDVVLHRRSFLVMRELLDVASRYVASSPSLVPNLGTVSVT
jgi:hypothetical protein